MANESAQKKTEDDAPLQDSFIIVSRDKRLRKDIIIKNLTVRLPDKNGTVLLKDLTHTIKPGERIILTGESGAGKTTTLKGLLGKWDTGSGHISIPEDLKIRAISQHVNLSNTTMRGILNLTPSDQYIFSDRELRDALTKVGLPQLVQHIPGQQAEVLTDDLMEEARTLLTPFKGKSVSKEELAEIEGKLIAKTEELAHKQFDYAQHVPQEQRQYIADQLSAVLADTLGGNAPSKKKTTSIANAIADKIDETLCGIVTDGLEKAVKQTAYFNARAKIFWPRAPLTETKAKFFAWGMRRSLNGNLKRYMKNADTEDTSREILINKQQSKQIVKELADSFKNDVMTNYVTRGGIKGALSMMFNLVTWPLDIIRIRLRAAKAAKELSQSLAFFMERQTVKGDTFSRQLSGGQKKKLMAARAMLHKPDLLVMDEITTGLDDASKQVIYKEILDALPPETTVISILHDLELTDLHTTHAHLENKTLTFTKVKPGKPKAP